MNYFSVRILLYFTSTQDDPIFIGGNKLLYKGDPITPGEVIENRMRGEPVY